MSDNSEKETKSGKPAGTRKSTSASRPTSSRGAKKTASARTKSDEKPEQTKGNGSSGGGGTGNGKGDGNGDGEQAPQQAAPAKSNRWLKIGLVLSLMLNALFVGAIGMRMYHVKQHGGWHGAGFSPSARMFLRELPRERRRELRQQFRKHHQDMRSARQDTRQATQDIIASLQSDNYDRAKLSSAFASLRSARDANATRHENLLLAMIDELTQEERKLMASSMERRMERLAERRRKFRERRKSERE